VSRVTLSPELAAPLLTDADVQERVDALIGAAIQDRCLWLILVDGDRKQAPVIMPIEDSPPRPDPDMVDGLQTVLAGFVEKLATDAGPGACVFGGRGPPRRARVPRGLRQHARGDPSSPVNAGGHRGGARRWVP